eukprot:Selendium_serpulae@DN5390_c0_g1_i2.p2
MKPGCSDGQRIGMRAFGKNWAQTRDEDDQVEEGHDDDEDDDESDEDDDDESAPSFFSTMLKQKKQQESKKVGAPKQGIVARFERLTIQNQSFQVRKNVTMGDGNANRSECFNVDSDDDSDGVEEVNSPACPARDAAPRLDSATTSAAASAATGTGRSNCAKASRAGSVTNKRQRSAITEITEWISTPAAVPTPTATSSRKHSKPAGRRYLSD